MNEIFEQIAKDMESMSKTHKKLACYLLENHSTVAFLNINTLARLSEVSEATIVRFCTQLGFKGYPDFKKKLQESVAQRLSFKERLAISPTAYGNDECFVTNIFRDDIQNINTTLENMDLSTFYTVVNLLENADQICIVCGRSAVSLGLFLNYYLELILGNSCIITSESDSTSLSKFGPNTVVFAITFSRYTKNTLRILEYAHSQKCTTITLTDHFQSPAIAYSNYTLFAETQMPSLLDTYVAPLSLINAIIAKLSELKKDTLDQRIQQFEKSWSAFDIFTE